MTIYFFATTIIITIVSSVIANPNCIGSKNCPVWPTEFDSPFGLYSPFPSIKNASSTFYYKFLPNGTQAQLISYDTRCFPFVNAKSALKSMPCKLLFINSGIYLSQPKHDIECCQFVKGVGAVPPNFLRSYTFKGTNVSAPDMYGNNVMCDYWEGPEDFKYWTTTATDKPLYNYGHDIVFQDGPTGVTWRWGNFNVRPQNDSMFELFADKETCSKTCTKFLSETEHIELTKHVNMVLGPNQN